MKLIIEAVQKMLNGFTTKDSGFNDTNVYLWLDYGCINHYNDYYIKYNNDCNS